MEAVRVSEGLLYHQTVQGTRFLWCGRNIEGQFIGQHVADLGLHAAFDMRLAVVHYHCMQGAHLDPEQSASCRQIHLQPI